MTTATGPSVAGLRAFPTRHPEAWVYAVAAGAFLLVLGRGHVGVGGSVPAVWALWMLMVVAMMLPVVAPQSRRIALRSLWRRRHRAIAGHLAGYLALWGTLGGVVVGVLAVTGLVEPPALLGAAVLVVGAVWQVAPARRRVLLRCETPRPAAVRGWAADRACIAAGWRAGGRCAVTCGPAMLAMALGHSALVMVVLTALLLSERTRGPNPQRRAGRPDEALGYLACAALTVVLG